MKSLDSHQSYSESLAEEKLLLQLWIAAAVEPDENEKKFPANSMDIKMNLEIMGSYISNGQFKGAMLHAGYAPVQENLGKSIYWNFCINRPCRNFHTEPETLPNMHFCLAHLSKGAKRLLRMAVEKANEAKRNVDLGAEQRGKPVTTEFVIEPE